MTSVPHPLPHPTGPAADAPAAATARRTGRAATVLAAGAAAAAALLAGCAATPGSPGVPPLAQPGTDQPHARLLTRSSAPAGHQLSVLVRQDNTACADPRLVLRHPAGGSGQARLPVQQLLTLDVVLLLPGGQACINRWSFTPQAGRTYVLQSTVVGSACPARLLDATQPERAAVPADLVSRVQAGQSCLPLDKAPKVAATTMIQGGQVNGEAVLLPQATTRPLQGLIRP